MRWQSCLSINCGIEGAHCKSKSGICSLQFEVIIDGNIWICKWNGKTNDENNAEWSVGLHSSLILMCGGVGIEVLQGTFYNLLWHQY